jgi:phosphohistidine phosphatase
MHQTETQYLILARHGRYHHHAVSDESRVLTQAGCEEIRRVARHLLDEGIRISQILHSGKKRAEQTAGIFAESLNPGQIKVSPGLRPGDDPEALIRAIEMESESTLIVSHLPLLDRVAELLPGLTGSMGPVHFPQGGTLCFIRNKSGLEAQWMITPEMLKA